MLDVNEAYEENDRERALLERVQDLNAEEINQHKERELAVAKSKLLLLDSFARFVPCEFLHFLSKKDIQDIVLGDAVQSEMTILFTDIRSFTSLSEKMTAEDNFKFLNAYLSRMGPIIKEFGGFIDKFIGDAIMALFPPDSAQKAVQAAIQMRRALAQYNQKRIQSGYVPIDTGIGINTGEVMLGTLGSHDRLSTTVIGDSVNLASRLESLTKATGCSIIITEYLYQKLPDVAQKYFERCSRITGLLSAAAQEIALTQQK